jgi:TolB protein
VTDASAGTPKVFLANSAIFSQPRKNQILAVHFPKQNGAVGVSIVNDSGATVREISLQPNAMNPFELSPNGTVLLYATPNSAVNSTYHLKNVTTGVDVVLTSIGGSGGTVAFSRDGTRIAFYEEADQSGRQDRLVVANVDGTGRVVVTDSAASLNGSIEEGLAWSAAGDRLYLTRYESGQIELWSIGVDGSTLTRLSGLMQSATMQAVSPDGKKIAFTAVTIGVQGADIWIVDADGSNPHQVTSGLAAGHVTRYPNWSPDGKKIIYTDSDGSGGLLSGALRMVDVASGTSTLLDAGPNVMWGYWEY